MSGIVAVEGLQFEIYEGGTLNPSGVVTVSSSCVPCSKVTIKGKKVYAGTLLVEVKGFSSILISNWVPSSGMTIAPASIVSTIQKSSTLEGKFFLVGDQTLPVVIQGQMTTPTGPVTTTTSVVIKIKTSPQNVVNAT